MRGLPTTLHLAAHPVTNSTRRTHSMLPLLRLLRLLLLQESGLCQENEARLEALSGQRSEAPLALAGRYATSRRTQRAWLIRRFFAIYWRSPNYSELPRVHWSTRVDAARATPPLRM